MKSTLKLTLLSLAFVAGVLVCTSLQAQTTSSGSIAIQPVNYGYGYGMPSYGYASTYEEGVLRGWADLWQGVGQYNYSTSLANVNNQEAYSRAIDNSVKRTNAYFARKAINEQARSSANPRPSAEDIARFAKERAPEGLAAHEFSSAVGSLNWPQILQGSDFAADRAELDNLFATRSPENSGLGTDNHRQIKQTADQMLATLKSRIGEYSPSEYVAAKSFLTRLERESFDGVSPLGVASR